jgi:hypothetical protein
VKLSLTTAGLFDPREFRAWTAERQRDIHAAVARGFRESGREVATQARAQMQSALQIKRPSFVKSLRATVWDQRPDRLPALRIGSRVPWLGIHERGGVISRPPADSPAARTPAHRPEALQGDHRRTDALGQCLLHSERAARRS